MQFFSKLLAGSLLAHALLAAAPSVDALIEAGHWKRARQIAEQKVQANSNDALAHMWLSKVKSGFNDLDGALVDAEKAVALDPKNPAYHGQLAEICALLADKSSPIKGYAYVRRMRKEIDAALAIDPKHIDTLLVDMMFSFKAPTIAGGDKRKARQTADLIQSISPVWGYLAHARLQQEANDDKGTEEVLQKAIAVEPKFYRARSALARFYCCTAQHKRLDAAEKAANEAIATDAGAAMGYEVLARVYATQQKWAELDKTLTRAEQAVPDDLSPYYAAADALFAAGQDFSRAERYLAHYLAQTPEARQPSHGQAHRLLGLMAEKSGRKEDAVRELQTAVKLDPSLEEAKRDLKRVRQT